MRAIRLLGALGLMFITAPAAAEVWAGDTNSVTCYEVTGNGGGKVRIANGVERWVVPNGRFFRDSFALHRVSSNSCPATDLGATMSHETFDNAFSAKLADLGGDFSEIFVIYVDSKASGVVAVDRSREEIFWGAIDSRTYLNPAGVNVVFELIDPAVEGTSDCGNAEFLARDFRFVVTPY